MLAPEGVEQSEGEYKGDDEGHAAASARIAGNLSRRDARSAADRSREAPPELGLLRCMDRDSQPVAAAFSRMQELHGLRSAAADTRCSANSGVSSGPESGSSVPDEAAANRVTFGLGASFCNRCASDTLSASVDDHCENRKGDVGLTRSAWDGCIVRLTAAGVHQLGDLVARCRRRRRRLKEFPAALSPLVSPVRLKDDQPSQRRRV
jgi:hypothetical protein